ncbi:MAG: 16S rRNA (guanine(966)-N(2))-methyltransferase RsmD [Rhizobiaceae bacterium]|nr:16S rRNA (guanine(966)-N(2))-methyltransferase RsmD [Rhizobiaceae bacterium]
MRVVGGKYRGHRLVAPKGLSTRPTTDRIRESLFNILNNRLNFEGLRVMDLFAGTGALGLEALSRGADYCVFVENSPQAIAAINQNIGAFNLAKQVLLLKKDATRLGTLGDLKPFDLVFADPPYGKTLGERAAESVLENGWLNPKAVFVLEEHSKAFPESLNSFELCDLRQFGDTSIGIFQLVN